MKAHLQELRAEVTGVQNEKGEQIILFENIYVPNGVEQSLGGKKLLTGQTERRRGVQDKTERIACLACAPEEALQYANSKRKSVPLQTAVLELLCNLGECAAKDLRYYTGATAAVLKRLETLGYLRFTEEEVLRIEKVVATPVTGALRLNEQQQRAYEGLRQHGQGVSLLYGVTGSGKTSVYIKLIYDVLEKGKSAIVLVPEIALTPQLLGLFASHFGEKAAVLHSGLRITERYDTWKRIRSGDARVVLGTRSAVFAPVQKLGLLIIDEEQVHPLSLHDTWQPLVHGIVAIVPIYRCAPVLHR